MVECALREGANLAVTIVAFNTTVLPNDTHYHYADIYEPLDGPFITRFSRLAAQYGTYIVADLYTSCEGKVYNSAVLIDPDGHIVGIYDRKNEAPLVTSANE